MFDFEIAFYLYKMAAYQNLFFDSPYRAKAYKTAAQALDAYDTYIEQMYHEGKLRDFPYVGDRIEKCIVEVIETGKLEKLEEYEREYGIKDYSLLLSHGLSDKLLKKLIQYQVTSAYQLLEDETRSMLSDRLTKGEYSKVLGFYEDFSRNQGQYLISYGLCLGREIIELLYGITGVESVFFTGDLADGSEKVKCIEINFVYNSVWKNLTKHIKKCSRLIIMSDIHDLEIQGQTKFGIPFCLRRIEKDDRIEEKKDYLKIYGDLHAHTTSSDGIHTIEEMAYAAHDRGYEYLAITDHSISQRIAHGLSEDQALDQVVKIHEFNKQNNEIKLLAGIEVDILPDGSLDYSDAVLEQFDFVVAAIHNNINQKPMELIDRLEKALANPNINILAHPTGRLLGRPGVLFSEREPFRIDAQTLFDICKRHDVALEVNCFPERLDLNEKNIALAVQKGLRISLGTDAHSLAHLCNMEYGMKLVADAGIPSNMILNTYSYDELIYFFKNQHEKRDVEKKSKIVPKRKDFTYYFKNNEKIMNGTSRIIGIDLTASEDKESGWAYLQGNYAECRRIATDAELIHSVEELKPDVVSIDSPLAYPKGRCCARKDCECSKYGILRESERMLRHFGIHVYPCLIDSMVNLTTRGMRLAKLLRDKGYHVIESYPGVAQDILQIARKGKTREQHMRLKQGLESFGLEGSWTDDSQVSHDELDAITSALVGYFYLNNQYVGMGNDQEDYLIVPRIQEELLKEKIVIGLCGETGAGKTTITEYLKFKYGLQSFRYSQVIAEKYQIDDKEKLQEVGLKISQNPEEQKALTRYMIEKMDDKKSYVIDGLRHMDDFNMLRETFGNKFVFLFIECKYTNRYQRYNKLHHGKISKEKFERINNHNSEFEIMLVRLQADFEINNDKGYKQLWDRIDQVIRSKSGGDI